MAIKSMKDRQHPKAARGTKPAAKKSKKSAEIGTKEKGPKAPKPPGRTKSQTVKLKPAAAGSSPLWDKLDKPWSLVDCKRMIALSCEHNSVMSKLAEIREQRKALRDEWDEDHDAATAKKILGLEDEQDKLKQRQKAICSDMLRLSIESVGGSLFMDENEADEERPKPRVRDVEGQQTLSNPDPTQAASSEPSTQAPEAVPSSSSEPVASDEPVNQEWRDLSIVALMQHAVPESAVDALSNAGFMTLGELQDRKIGPNGAPGRLTLVKGITAKSETQIEDAIRKIKAGELAAEPVGAIADAE